MGGGRGGGGFKGTKGSIRKSGKSAKTYAPKGMPRNNQKQNEQARAVSRELGLTKDQERQLHDMAQNQGWGYQEMREHAEEAFGKK